MGNENSKETDLIQENVKIHEKHENGAVNGISVTITANGYSVDVPTKIPTEQNVDAPLPEVTTEATEYAVLESISQPIEAEVTAEAPEPSPQTEEIKPKEEKVSLFGKMLKKKTAPVIKKETESTKDQTDMSPAATDEPLKNEKIHEKHENGNSNAESPLPEVKTETTEYAVLESISLPTEAEVTAETPDPSPQKEEIKPKEEKVSLFSKMFKNKTAPVVKKETEKQPESSPEDQTDKSPAATDPQPETDNLKQESESLPEPERVVVEDSGPEQKGEKEASELEKGNSILVKNQDSKTEDNSVMNFFKTIVSPTKTSKKEAPAADATKDQPEPPESQPAPATTVAQVSDPPAAPKGMPVPPPPPPELPKLDIKAEPAAKAVKATPKEEPKPAAKDSPKGKKTKDTLSRFFRPKTTNEEPQPAVEEPQPVEVQETPEEVLLPVVEAVVEKIESIIEADVPQPVVDDQKTDASKASTLEAAAKPEPAPAAQEEKKAEPKAHFLSLFKPKALLDHMTATVQAASTSGVRLFRKTTGAAAEPKATPAPATAAAEPGPAKEEAPKAAKSTEAAAEAKPATAAPSGGEEDTSASKKVEKRNSIHKFFKTLGQKHHSTDAGAQPEAAPAPSAETK